MLKLEKLVSENVFNMRKDELSRLFSSGYVGIHYTFNSYEETVSHILRLKDEVLKDYPDITDEYMYIHKISRSESIRHVGHMTLFVHIPIEDYLQLRKEHGISIL